MRRIIELSIATILTLYFLSLGGTFNAILMPDLQRFSLILLVATFVVWLIVRRIGKWAWHPTPFDPVIVLWSIVLVLSIAANPETWRRSMDAMWFMLLYLLVWYTIADAFANGMNRRFWLNAMLLVGVVQVPLVLVQVVYYYADGGTGLVRPMGSTGNPNLLGALCVVLLPLTIANAMDAAKKPLIRRAHWAFAGLIVAMLAMTFSRGAWLATAVVLLTVGGFWLHERGISSSANVRDWWQRASQNQRRLLSIVVSGTVLGLLGLLLFMVSTLSIAGRGAEYRTGLWECAWQMFTEQPLIGQGLFTFGYHQGACQSIPPQQPHAHPHSLPLLILAELGLAGGAVAFFTLLVIVRTVRVQWPQVPTGFKWQFVGVTAALVGTGVQHLLDTTITHPFVALMVILLMAVVLIPIRPTAVTTGWRKVDLSLGVAAAWVMLFVIGFWQLNIISQYNAVLAFAVREGNPAAAAARLEHVIKQDPANAAYRRQHAYLLGIAAAREASQLDAAISAYITLNRMEPNYAVDFVNHAALRWQNRQVDEAIALAERAASLAMEWGISRDLLAYYRGELPQPPARTEAIYAAATVNFQMLRYIIVEELLPQIERASP